MPDPLAVKTVLLEMLRKSSSVRCGCRTDALAEALACDRQAVIRSLEELKGHGYEIDRTRQTWRLVSSPDIPFPFEFPGRQDRIYFFPQTASTMDEARKMAGRGCPDRTVVVAGIQTSGRGRMERVWASDEGGLYFTVVLRPNVRPAEAIKFNFMASLALVEVLREQCRLDARVKWPNDIMVGEGKLSGMLSEMDAVGDTVNFINIGIGVNVNNDPARIEPRAVSVRSLTGSGFSRVHILSRFLDRLDSGTSRADLAEIIRQWKQYAGCLQRDVTIVTHKESFQGFAEDVDEGGALVLRLADGTRRAVCYGDCFYG